MSITSWSRIEPYGQSTDINVGLAAEIADPLWFILRQWQFGELRGDDAGSPVALDIATSWSRFTRYFAGPTSESNDNGVPLTPNSEPIETTVEREAVFRFDGDEVTAPWTASLRAGRLLRRLLIESNLATTADQLAGTAPFSASTHYVSQSLSDLDRRSGTDDRYPRLLSTGTIDAALVLTHVATGTITSILGEGADQSMSVISDWVEQVRAEWGISAPREAMSPAWLRDRLEYEFAVAAPPLPGETTEYVLRAREYDGTGVTWDTFDLDRTTSLSASDDAVVEGNVDSAIRTLIPTPVRYPGMPSDRFWEFEDAAVSLGSVSSGTTDLARLLAIDFAIIYSPDWFVAPVEVPVGCVARIDWVVVRDTFGVATLVGTTATQSGDGVGRQFQPSSFDGAEGDNPILVCVQSALSSLTSTAREEITVQRDEAANVAWSIEKSVMGPSGRAVARPWFKSEFNLPPSQAPTPHDFVWRLATPVAKSWTPLVPRLSENGRMLRPARIIDTTTSQTYKARSLLLADVDEICDEEITSAGIQLRVLEQLARTHSGRISVWRGREKRPATGEASSGLQFDVATHS